MRSFCASAITWRTFSIRAVVSDSALFNSAFIESVAESRVSDLIEIGRFPLTQLIRSLRILESASAALLGISESSI